MLPLTLAASGCSGRRLDPAGLAPSTRAARAEAPLSTHSSHRGKPRARPPRPGAPPAVRATPSGQHPAPTIPAPPFRLDVRVDPSDLALLPPKAAIIAAMRPDLLAGLASLLQWRSGLLWSLLGTSRSAQELVTSALRTPFGLRPDRMIVVSLLSPLGSQMALTRLLRSQARSDPGGVARAGAARAGAARAGAARAGGARAGGARAGGARAGVPAALAPGTLPPVGLHLRAVAQVAAVAKARAAVAELARKARSLGFPLRLTSAHALPAPLQELASRGVVAVGMTSSDLVAFTVTGGRLLLDIIAPVSGKWSPVRAARELGALLTPSGTNMPPAADPRPPGHLDQFERLTLVSSADLSVILRGRRLARAAQLLGTRAPPGAAHPMEPSSPSVLVAKARSNARLPTLMYDSTPRPFAGCGLRLYLSDPRPQLRVSWRLTSAGHKLLDHPSTAAAGRDLAMDNRLVERWLKPIAARSPEILPPTGPFARPELHRDLAQGGVWSWLLALSDLWPRLIPRKPLRKMVIKVLRTRIRPRELLGRINVRLLGQVLELALEMRAAASAARGQGK